MKRFIVILMTLCMVLGMSSIGAFGAEKATWQEETPMPTNLAWGGACTVGDEIYVIGNSSKGRDHTVIYDIKTGTWSTGQSVPTSRYGLTASLVGDKIYVIGGNGSQGAVSTVEIYDVKTNTWSTGKSMPTARYYGTASIVGDKIYVIGGMVDAFKTVDAVEIYDTQSDTWSTGQSMPTAGRLSTSSVIGNKIYVIGGEDTERKTVNTVKIYDTQADTWTTGQSMPTGRHLLTSSVSGNKIYAIGGYDLTTVYNTVEIYDVQTNTWSTGQSMPTGRYALMSSVVGDKIYVIGGRNVNNYLATVESLKVSSAETGFSLLSVLLNIGENVQLSTSYNLADNANYTWSSTNEVVATVDANGKVTAVAVGEADIYAQNADGTFKEHIPVKVVEGIADELRLAVHLNVGEKAKLYLTDNPSEVTWSSMDESVAIVSTDGQVTAVKKGLAIIQGELAGQTYQIYVRVNG